MVTNPAQCFRVFLMLAIAVQTFSLYAQEPSSADLWRDDLRARLSELSRVADQTDYYTAVCVHDLTTDEPVYAYNARKLMRPASTQKLITAVAALDRLGKDYAFQTTAQQTGVMDGTTLVGSLVIKGGFDPVFSYADLKQMAQTIKQAGIDSIAGQIIADVSMTDGVRQGSGWCWDDVPSSIVPWLTPLFFNHQQDIDSRSKVCVERPEEYFLQMLRNELLDCGVGLAPGAPTYTSFPQSTAQATRVLYQQRHTLEQVLMQMMKKSDNLHAEAVFYLLGSTAKFSQTGWKDCARQVENFLNKIGAAEGSYAVADGSGLSLYNYVSAATEVAVLRYAYQQPAIYTTLSPSLPVAGVDGTLERRMTRGSAHRNVRAKTGSVRGCYCLAGYVTASNGHILAFSIMNNGALKGDVARSLQDRYCEELAR